eukprot:c14656_g1_i1 orf=1-534(-)
MEALVSIQSPKPAWTSLKASCTSCLFHTLLPRPSIQGAVLRKPLQSCSFIYRKLGSGARGARCLSYNGSSGNSKLRWDEDDSNYLEAQVVEAVSLLPSQGHLFMTLANGGEVEIDHVNPPKGRLLYRSRNPTMFLRILCEDELFLPLIVGDVAVGMLMKALRGDESPGRPNQYHLMRD